MTHLAQPLEAPPSLAQAVSAMAGELRLQSERRAQEWGPVAALHALILATLARLFSRLEALVQAWQQGLVPAASTRPGATRPARTILPELRLQPRRATAPRARRVPLRHTHAPAPAPHADASSAAAAWRVTADPVRHRPHLPRARTDRPRIPPLRQNLRPAVPPTRVLFVTLS